MADCETQDNEKILLLGGNGFLGMGLQDEMSKRSLRFESIDICDMDLSKKECIQELSMKIGRCGRVVLLAAKIGRELFKNSPYENYLQNEMIFDNVISAMRDASSRTGKSFGMTFYSTSEIFGSVACDEIITATSPIQIIPYGRGLYARQKFFAEERLEKMMNSENFISSLHILRPFNVVGSHQARGVVYDMVKSALESGKIWYSDSTVRSFTSSDFAAKLATDIIVSDSSLLLKENLTEGLTFYMEDIALLVRSAIGDDKIKIVENNPDSDIQYRQTAPYRGGDIEAVAKMYRMVETVLGEYRKNACGQHGVR